MPVDCFKTQGFMLIYFAYCAKLKKKKLSQRDRFLCFIPSQMNSSTLDLISQNIFILHV